MTILLEMNEDKLLSLITLLDHQRREFVACHGRATLARDVAAARGLANAIAQSDELIADCRRALDVAATAIAIMSRMSSATDPAVN